MNTQTLTLRHAVLCILMAISLNAAAQKPTIAVLNIDSRIDMIKADQTMANMVRLELEKTGQFIVMDRYEVADVIAKNKIDAANCLSKSCVVQTGKLLGVNKMLSGTIEQMGEKIVITLR